MGDYLNPYIIRAWPGLLRRSSADSHADLQLTKNSSKKNQNRYHNPNNSNHGK